MYFFDVMQNQSTQTLMQISVSTSFMTLLPVHLN